MAMDWKKGVSLSMYQNAGEQEFETNWSDQVRRKKDQSPFPDAKDVIGISSDFWNRYEGDVQLAKGLGVTSMRISVEWHRIEPKPGEINQDAIQRYHSIFQAIKDAGIEPVATLHHFVHPKWYEDMGGFLEEGNLPLFVKFCETVVKEFSKYATQWVTFNEPAVVCVTGYWFGLFPPEQRVRAGKAGRMFLNLLKAHSMVYQAIKEFNASLQVGLVHQFIEMVPEKKWHVHTAPIAARITQLFSKQIILEWFTTGTFRWYSGVVVGNIDYKSPERPKIDFLGMNYYSRLVLAPQFKLIGMPGEPVSDTGFPVFAEGLTGHLLDAKVLGVPIYVTEFGAADRQDRIRPQVIRDYYIAALKALKQGVDLRGMFVWTLIDNFEWHEAYDQQFGLYACDIGTKELERVPREKSVNLVRKLNEILPESAAQVKEKVDELISEISQLSFQ